MRVAAAIVARDEEPIIGRAIDSAKLVADRVVVLDTGSTDETRRVATAAGAEVYEREWAGFADARTAALALTRDDDWTLMLDADQTVTVSPGGPELREWLAADPDPDVDAWQIGMIEGNLLFRFPRLTRGGIDWRYAGPTHEVLDLAGRKQRELVGLTIWHHLDGGNRATKHERDLELLAPGVEADDPRSVYYSAQALWGLGRIPEAIEMYRRRSGMGGWEEERWHALYMEARLAEDVDGLLVAHRLRRHRPEPLEHAARIVRERGTSDILFLERQAASR